MGKNHELTPKGFAESRGFGACFSVTSLVVAAILKIKENIAELLGNFERCFNV